MGYNLAFFRVADVAGNAQRGAFFRIPQVPHAELFFLDSATQGPPVLSLQEIGVFGHPIAEGAMTYRAIDPLAQIETGFVDQIVIFNKDAMAANATWLF